MSGYVIECITGQDYCEYVHENIFKPLGMEHTALNPTHSDNEWVYEQRKKTKSYRFSLGHCIDLGSCLYYIPAYPAGAATGTLSDLMTYAQALLNDDAPLFDDPQTQKMMFSATNFYGSSDIPMCAHGFWCTEYSVRTYGHSGATVAGQANLIFDLNSKTGLAIMVNEPNGNDFLYDAPSLVFGKLSPDKYASENVEKVKQSGYYRTCADFVINGVSSYRFLPDEPIDNRLIGDEGYPEVRYSADFNKESHDIEAVFYFDYEMETSLDVTVTYKLSLCMQTLYKYR